MIKLYSFGKNLGLADPSPFVLKVDLFMKLAGIDFETVPGAQNLRTAPKGKLPYIKDGSEIIADSFFIINYLNEKYNLTLDSGLTEQDKAIATLISKSIEENLYWCIIYSRWLQDDTWPIIKQTFFADMPFPLNTLVPIIAKKGIQSAFKKHGMGNHNNEEILTIAKSSLSSLSDLLSDKDYFFNNKPSSFDATAFAFLSQITISTISNPLSDLARSYDNLVRYCERIQKQYYDS